MELIIEEKNESNFESIINLNNEINQNTNNIPLCTTEVYTGVKTKENNKGTNKGTDECMELKNIKYKTMLMKGVALKDTSSSNDLSNLDKFLDNEKTNNKNDQWCKLDKTVKTQKLLAFAEAYKKENELDEEEAQILIKFFKDCLDKKKLARVKDVIYDKVTGEIKEIPALLHSKRHFTLKNVEKRVSTIKSLTLKKTNTKTLKERDSKMEE
jgi:hypothetical protein